VLRSSERFVFWYLYSLLDHFSRKAVAWLVHPTFCSEQIQTLWDLGLVNEGRLDLPADQWPRSLSDRGAQMRSQSTRRYFKKLGIDQLFSRPRQPNDKGYAAYCTSFEHSETTSGMRRRFASFRPRCLVGASAVGGS
jgi:transposase InsO family protein